MQLKSLNGDRRLMTQPAMQIWTWCQILHQSNLVAKFICQIWLVLLLLVAQIKKVR